MKKQWLFALLALVLAAASCQRVSGFAPQGPPDVAIDFEHPPEHVCDVDSETFGDFYCKDGEWHMDNSGRGGVGNAGGTFGPPDLKDFMLQAEIRSVSGSGSYGVQFRSPEGNEGYVFLVRPTGDFRLVLGVNPNAVLVPWTPSSAIDKGTASNLLEVIAQGNRITLFANGTQVASVQDDILKAGGAGVTAADGGHAAVSKFSVWILP